MHRIIIEENDAGQRLDRFLRKYLSRAPLSSIYRMIRKDLKVNGKRSKRDMMLECGDELVIYLSDEKIAEFTKAREPVKARRQFGIAYEDEHVLIVDKPAGLLTHGDRSEKKNTLVNQVCGYLQQEGCYDPSKEKVFRPSPVNRLDRNTTGLVIFGKNAEATRALTGLLRERDGVRKYYRTIVCGRVEEEQTIEETLLKDEDRNLVQVVAGQEDQSGGNDHKTDGAKGRKSISIVRPISSGDDFSLVEVELVTGRTHQIRVHMAHTGHPLAADPKYGDPAVNAGLKREGLTSQFLHACRLEFAPMDEADAGRAVTDPDTAGDGNTGGDVLAGIRGRSVVSESPKGFKKAEKMLVGRS